MARRYIIAGSTGQSVDVFLQDRTSGDGVITLTTDKVKGAFRVGTTGAVTTFALVGRNTTAAWASGGWAEVSSVNMPGVYTLDVPDASLASTPTASYFLQCSTPGSNFIPVAVDVQLVSSIGADIPVDVKKFGGTNVTARDIGASVLLSSGTGTGQVVLSAGNPTVLLSSGTGTGQVVLTSGNPTVLLSSGTGAGQIKLTGGQVDVAQFAGATLSTGTAHFGVNVMQINGVAASAVATINPILGTSQAVNFATTGSTAGIKADIQTIAGAAVSTATAHFGVNVVQVGGSSTVATNLKSAFDTNWVTVFSSQNRFTADVTHANGTAWTSGAIVAGSFASGAIDATAIAANAIGASELASDAANEIADAILDRDMSVGTDSGSTSVRTPRQALRFLRNKWAISGTTMSVYKEDDATASWTAVLTGTSGADPITAVDPA